MKKIFISIIFFIISFSLNAQNIFEPDSVDYKRMVIKADNYPPVSDGLTFNNYRVWLGRSGYIRYRVFYEWIIPDNIIPDNSSIDTIEIFFIYKPFVSQYYLALGYFNVGEDLISPNLDTLWNRTDGWKSSTYYIGEGQGFKYGYQGTRDDTVKSIFTNMSNPIFTNAFKNSLLNDKFVLGFVAPTEINYQYQWEIVNYTVKLRVVFSPPKKSVMIDQKLSNNTSIDSVGFWDSFQNKFNKFSVPQTLELDLYSNITLQSSQKIINNQKYNNWNELSNVTNHRSFIINEETTNLTSNFVSTYSNITIKNNFLEGTNLNPSNDSIDFKDPWLIDYPDTAYGNNLRNQGMSAPYKQRSSPFNPDYSTNYNGDVYKGVFLNQDYNVPGQPYYSVRANQTYQFNGINYKFIGWTAEPFNSAEFQNQRALQTPVVFKNENAIINGFYKGNFVTNSSNALTTNSQRKLLSIDDTNFLVYESDSKIFFTAKQPLENNWEPEYLISNINHQAKNPSADYYNYNIAVVYEYYNPMNNEYGIYLWESVNFDTIGTYTKVADINSNYFGRAKPVVAYSNGEIFIAYKKSETEGIKFRRKYKNSSGEWIWSSESTIPYTNAYSINVSIAVGPKYSFTNYVHLVWEETNKIKYLHGYWQAYDRRFNDYYEISNGSGYKSNEQPIVSLTEGELYPIVSWIVGNNLIAQKVSKETILNEKKIITRVKHSNWGDFFITGNDVEYGVNSSTSSSNAESIIAWSEANGQRSKYVKRIGTNYSSIKNISPIGLHLQLSNGNNLSDIKGVIYTPSGSLPYVFHDITTLFDGSIQLSKENNDNKIFYGRTGVINKSDLQFVFNIGDILVDDEEVKFVEKLDTIPVSNIEELNFAMRTNKFKLNNNSEFYFSNFYYVLNADLADSIMSNNDKFIFKVELIKDTEEIVGVLEKVEFDKNNLNEFNNINYQVNCEGIEEGEYYLRLVADFYGKNEVYLSNIMNEDINFEKKHYEDVYFDGKTLPTTYELSQNYPNPFNPSTTINYQIPKAGFVSLKVYDILGREVAVLVSGEKEVGKYTVQFDGSKLASGVYIYELRANEFVSVKKLMLLK